MKRILTIILVLVLLCSAACTEVKRDIINPVNHNITEPEKSDTVSSSDSTGQSKELTLHDKLSSFAKGKDFTEDISLYPFTENDIGVDETERIFTETCENIFALFTGKTAKLSFTESPHKMITLGESVSMWTIDGFVAFDHDGERTDSFFGIDIDMQTGKLYAVNFDSPLALSGSAEDFTMGVLALTEGNPTGETDVMEKTSGTQRAVRIYCEDDLIFRAYIHEKDGKSYVQVGFVFTNGLPAQSLPVTATELLPAVDSNIIADSAPEEEMSASFSESGIKVCFEQKLSALIKEKGCKHLVPDEYEITECRQIITGYHDAKYDASYIITIQSGGCKTEFQLTAKNGELYRICGRSDTNLDLDKVLSGFMSQTGTKPRKDRITFCHNDFSAIYVVGKDNKVYYAGQYADGAFSVGVSEGKMWI